MGKFKEMEIAIQECPYMHGAIDTLRALIADEVITSDIAINYIYNAYGNMVNDAKEEALK